MGKLFNNNNKIARDSAMTAPNGASDGSGLYERTEVMSMDMHMFGMMFS